METVPAQSEKTIKGNQNNITFEKVSTIPVKKTEYSINDIINEINEELKEYSNEDSNEDSNSQTTPPNQEIETDEIEYEKPLICSLCKRTSEWGLFTGDDVLTCDLCLTKILQFTPKEITGILSKSDCDWEYLFTRKNDKYPPILVLEWLKEKLVANEFPCSEQLAPLVMDLANKLIYTNGVDLNTPFTIDRKGDNNDNQNIQFISERAYLTCNKVLASIQTYFEKPIAKFLVASLTASNKIWRNERKNALNAWIGKLARGLIPIYEYFLIRRELATGSIVISNSAGKLCKYKTCNCLNIIDSQSSVTQHSESNYRISAKALFGFIDICYRGLINLMWNNYFVVRILDFANFMVNNFDRSSKTSQLSVNIIDRLLECTFGSLPSLCVFGNANIIPDINNCTQENTKLNCPYLGNYNITCQGWINEFSMSAGELTLYDMWYGEWRPQITSFLDQCHTGACIIGRLAKFGISISFASDEKAQENEDEKDSKINMSSTQHINKNSTIDQAEEQNIAAKEDKVENSINEKADVKEPSNEKKDKQKQQTKKRKKHKKKK